MNRILCKKGMVLGIIFLFFGAGVVINKGESVNKEDQSITDYDGDIYHVSGPGNWENSSERSRIDIEKISYRVSNGELNLTLELYDDIEDSDNITYHAYYRSDDATYLFFWRNGSGFGLEWPEHFEKDAAMLTIDEDKFTIKDENVSCLFGLLGDDISKVKLYGYAYEWIQYTDEDDFEYWVDFAFGVGENVTPYEYKQDKLDSVYVKEDYGSEDPCYQIDHFGNIGDGIDCVNTKGDVYVLNGTYYGKVDVDKPINLLGQNRDTTVIDGNGYGHVVNLMEDVNNVLITGFKIQNSGSTRYNSGISISSSGNHIYRNNITNNNLGIKDYLGGNRIGYNEIFGNQKEGIIFYSENRDSIIENNSISSNGLVNQGDGIHIKGGGTACNIKIFNNTIENSEDDGIHIMNSNHIEVYNNLIMGSAGGNSAGIYIYDSRDILVHNNTIYMNNYGMHVHLLLPDYNNTIENNTFMRNHISLFLKFSSFIGEHKLHDNNFLDADVVEISGFCYFAWGPSNWWGDAFPGPQLRGKILGLGGLFIAHPWATERYPIHHKV